MQKTLCSLQPKKDRQNCYYLVRAVADYRLLGLYTSLHGSLYGYSNRLCSLLECQEDTLKIVLLIILELFDDILFQSYKCSVSLCFYWVFCSQQIILYKKMFKALLFALLIWGSFSAPYLTASPTWQTNTLSRAGHKQVISDYVNLTTIGDRLSSPGYIPDSFSFVFPGGQSFTAAPHVAYGIRQYSGSDTIAVETYIVTTAGVTASSFSIRVTPVGVVRVWLMDIAYFAIQKTFPHHFNAFDSIPVDQSSTSLSSTTMVSEQGSSKVYTNYIDYPTLASGFTYTDFSAGIANFEIVMFMTTLSVKMCQEPCNFLETYNDFWWSVEAVAHDANTIKLDLRGAGKIRITQCAFSMVVFDKVDVVSTNKYQLVFQEHDIDMSTTSYIDFPQQFEENLIMGVKYFNAVDNYRGFDVRLNFVYNGTFEGAVIDPTTIRNKVSYCDGGLDRVVFSLLYLKTWVCPNGYDYFNITTQLCQTNCSDYYYENETDFVCYQCYETCIDCLSASANNCTVCDTASNFVLVNSSCVCSPGYALVVGSCVLVCGNGVIEGASGQICDDGNTASSDGCSSICLVETGYLCTSEPSVCVLTCSNSVIDSNQTCDDGNLINDDGCDDTCTTQNLYSCVNIPMPSVCTLICSNSLIDGNETCDDGNLINSDGCSSICQTEDNYVCINTIMPSICNIICSNNLIDGNQTCDDGNLVNSDGCSDVCQTEPLYDCNNSAMPSVCTLICSNSLIDSNETCDDGNLINTDGCNSLCQIQSGYSCNGQPSVCQIVCGDGVIATIEPCDDNNTISGDGCASNCSIQDGYQCTNTSPPSVCNLICSNGVLDLNETCDDANLVVADGCNSNCQVELGYDCVGEPSLCTFVCGNGVLNTIQECDDGNLANTDGCTDLCLIQPLYECPTVNTSCNLICSNSALDAGEECDDGNADDADGCNSTCLVEPQWQCFGTPSVCNLVCSNSRLDLGEGCDDGNLIDGDGCDSNCTVEDYYECLGSGIGFITNCRLICSNGILDGNQTCDDGNIQQNDGCDPNCTVQFNYNCTGQPSICIYLCGNGIIDVQEQCDDGNLTNMTNGDGCDTLCVIQDNYICFGEPSVCILQCGNGIIDINQTCDDGNNKTGDGCNSECISTVGWWVKNIWLDSTSCNTVNMDITLNQTHDSLHSVDYHVALQTNHSSLFLQSSSFSSGTIKLVMTFNDHVQNAQVNISFDSAHLSVNTSMLTPLSLTTTLTSSDLRPLYYYPSETCQQKQSYQAIADAIYYGSYVILLLSAVPGKIIGLQLFGVLQLAFFSLGNIDEVDILLQPLQALKGVNGLNLGLAKSNQTDLPERVQLIGYSPNFLDNCDAMLILLLCELSIAFVVYIIAKMVKESSPRVYNVAQRLIKQILLTLVLFNSFNIAYSAGIHFRYASSQDPNYMMGLLAAICGLVIMFAVVISLMVAEEAGFGEYKDKFKGGFVQRGYFVVTLFFRVSLGIYIAASNEDQFSTLFAVGICIAFILYNFINLPFTDAYHNYRANLCHITMLITLFVALYYRSMKSNTPKSEVAYIHQPARLEIAAILICMMVSLIVLTYDSYLFVRECIKSSKNKEQDVQKKVEQSEPNLSSIGSQNEVFSFASIQQGSMQHDKQEVIFTDSGFNEV